MAMDLGLVLIHNRTRVQNQAQVTGLAAALTLDPAAQTYTITGLAAAHTCRVYHLLVAANTVPNNLGTLAGRVITLPPGATDGRVFNVATKRAVDEGMEGVLQITDTSQFNATTVSAAYTKISQQNLGYLASEPFGRVVSARFLRAIRAYLNDGGTFAALIETYKARATAAGVDNG